MLSDRQIVRTKRSVARIASQLSLNALRQIVVDTAERAGLAPDRTFERAEMEIIAAAYRDELARRETRISEANDAHPDGHAPH
jgi:hypothetical protein